MTDYKDGVILEDLCEPDSPTPKESAPQVETPTVVWGPTHPRPDGAVYRVGTSTGATMEPHPETADYTESSPEKKEGEHRCQAVRAVEGHSLEPSKYRWCSPCGKLLEDHESCAKQSAQPQQVSPNTATPRLAGPTPRTDLTPHPDVDGFRYILMWMNHILNSEDATADPSFVMEWRDFVLECQRELAATEAARDLWQQQYAERDRDLAAVLAALAAADENKIKLAQQLAGKIEELAKERDNHHATRKRLVAERRMSVKYMLMAYQHMNRADGILTQVSPDTATSREAGPTPTIEGVMGEKGSLLYNVTLAIHEANRVPELERALAAERDRELAAANKTIEQLNALARSLNKGEAYWAGLYEVERKRGDEWMAVANAETKKLQAERKARIAICEELRQRTEALQAEVERLRGVLEECRSSVAFDLIRYEQMLIAKKAGAQYPEVIQEEANRLFRLLAAIDSANGDEK